MKNTLVTCFGPFDNFSINPTQEVARALASENDHVEVRTLPVVFGTARSEILEVLEDIDPELVISLGLNGYIGHVALERIALNISSSDIPDNSGNIREEMSISEGPLAFKTGLPTQRIMDSLLSEGVPARRSYSAGTYICNEIFYTVMEWCDERECRGGFVHMPMATEMMASDVRMYRYPHMSLSMLKRAGQIILDASRL